MLTDYQTQIRPSFVASQTIEEESSSDAASIRDHSPRRIRPQSVMAQNFSITLDHIFNINDDIISLTNDVDRKRQSVSLQTFELRALEAQLREVDERLRNAGVKTKPHRQSIYSNASPFALGKLDEFIFPPADEASGPKEGATGTGSTASSMASDRLPGLDMENSSEPGEGDEGVDEEADEGDEEEDEDEDEEEKLPRTRKRSVVLSIRANEARKAREQAAAAARGRSWGRG